MAITLWNLLEASILCLNAICVLHEERFLAKIGWSSSAPNYGFAEQPSMKSNVLNLIRSIRTVMRIPLIFVNSLAIIKKLLLELGLLFIGDLIVILEEPLVFLIQIRNHNLRYEHQLPSIIQSNYFSI